MCVKDAAEQAVNWCMKRSVLLGSVYAVFLTCSLLSLLFGETGVTALARLTELNRRLESNLEDLYRKRGQLVSRLSDMRSDSEAIAIEARSMGLYNQGERVLLSEGLGEPNVLPEAGSLLSIEPLLPRRRKDGFRYAAAAVGVIVLLFGLISQRTANAYQTRG